MNVETIVRDRVKAQHARGIAAQIALPSFQLKLDLLSAATGIGRARHCAANNAPRTLSKGAVYITKRHSLCARHESKPMCARLSQAKAKGGIASASLLSDCDLRKRFTVFLCGWPFVSSRLGGSEVVAEVGLAFVGLFRKAAKNPDTTPASARGAVANKRPGTAEVR